MSSGRAPGVSAAVVSCSVVVTQGSEHDSRLPVSEAVLLAALYPVLRPSADSRVVHTHFYFLLQLIPVYRQKQLR